MKFAKLAAVAAVLLAGLALAQDEGAPKEKATTKTAPPADTKPADAKDAKQKASYGIGLKIGRQFKGQKIDLDVESVTHGLQDGMSGAKPQFTDAEIQAAVQAYERELKGKLQQAAEQNQKDGAAFLAANKKKPGVKSLPSGLQYKVLKEGKGESPKPTDTVNANYRGTLIDGTEFDSSYTTGKPATFPVQRVIPGWQEALPLMKVGSKWQIYVPAELAYGPQPQATIPPNSTLIFDIELLGVEKGRAPVPGSGRNE
jgi:FKBP-type peptidyl-prolyl cis-trans isomerase FklB